MARRPHGFTLVELLVVIGIIAILVAILLPTLNKARQQASTVACEAQLRTIAQGAMIYSAENGGSMPWGLAWRTSKNGYSPLTSSPDYYGTKAIPLGGQIYLASCYRWCKQISDLMTRSPDGGVFPNSGGIQLISLSKAFRCPELNSNDYYSAVPNGYAANPVVMPNRPFELNPLGDQANYISGIPMAGGMNWAPKGGTSFAIAPAKVSQMYGDTAIIWDTNVCDGGVSATSFTPSNCFGGFGMSAIDGGQMADPRKGWRRYRGTLAGGSRLPVDLPDKPILFHTKPYERTTLSGAGRNYVNTDPFNGYLSVVDQSGNVRFRHNGDKAACVAFADGSVRVFTLNVNEVAYSDNTTILPIGKATTPPGPGIWGDCAKSDFLRSYLQIKRPGRCPPEVAWSPTEYAAQTGG